MSKLVSIGLDITYQFGNIGSMETIRNWRSSKNMGIDEAGALIGVSGVQWHRYETGVRNIPPARAIDIERITGISRQELRPDIFGEAA